MKNNYFFLWRIPLTSGVTIHQCKLICVEDSSPSLSPHPTSSSSSWDHPLDAPPYTQTGTTDLNCAPAVPLPGQGRLWHLPRLDSRGGRGEKIEQVLHLHLEVPEICKQNRLQYIHRVVARGFKTAVVGQITTNNSASQR